MRFYEDDHAYEIEPIRDPATQFALAGAITLPNSTGPETPAFRRGSNANGSGDCRTKGARIRSQRRCYGEQDRPRTRSVMSECLTLNWPEIVRTPQRDALRLSLPRLT